MMTPKKMRTNKPPKSPLLPPPLLCDELPELWLLLLELWLPPELCDPPELCPPPARASTSAADSSEGNAMRAHFAKRERGRCLDTEEVRFLIRRSGFVQVRGQVAPRFQLASRKRRFSVCA